MDSAQGTDVGEYRRFEALADEWMPRIEQTARGVGMHPHEVVEMVLQVVIDRQDSAAAERARRSD